MVSAGHVEKGALPMFEIFKTYRFEAAHFLPFLPDGHKCKRLHGHSYKVTVCVQGDLNEDHMVIEFEEIDKVVKPIIEELDHTNLNEKFDATSSEYIARALFNLIKPAIEGLTSVEVSETDKTGARYFVDNVIQP